MNLHKDILTISNIFKENGKKLFIIGGSVRDHILGKEPKDFDLATDALPNEVEEMMKPHFKTLDIGKAFGVIVVLTPSFSEGLEIATFRSDGGPGRRPNSVTFSNIETDVNRRDFTINALFYNIETDEIIDFVGGKDDLEAKLVKTVGDADLRFSEDELRKLRAIRFSSKNDFRMHKTVFDSIQNNNSLNNVSSERIRDEFLKMIENEETCEKSIKLIQELNLFPQIFPELEVSFKNFKFDSKEVVIASLLKTNDIEKIKIILNKLSYTKEEISSICFLVSLFEFKPENIFEFKKKRNILVHLSDDSVIEFCKRNFLNMKLIQNFLSFQLTVTGQELLNKGYTGVAIGHLQKSKEVINFKKLISKSI